MKKIKNDYIIEYFNNSLNHNREIKLSEADYAIKLAYQKDNPEDNIYTNRPIRALYKKGHPNLKGTLERVSKGIYLMTPGKKIQITKSPFTNKVKEQILKRDKYQCQWCGKKKSKKTFLAVDHVVPEDEEGKGVYHNGITLCYVCNNLKKNLGVSSFGKKMFQKYLKISQKNQDISRINFLKDILSVFEKYDLK